MRDRKRLVPGKRPKPPRSMAGNCRQVPPTTLSMSVKLTTWKKMHQKDAMATVAYCATRDDESTQTRRTIPGKKQNIPSKVTSTPQEVRRT